MAKAKVIKVTLVQVIDFAECNEGITHQTYVLAGHLDQRQMKKVAADYANRHDYEIPEDVETGEAEIGGWVEFGADGEATEITMTFAHSVVSSVNGHIKRDTSPC